MIAAPVSVAVSPARVALAAGETRELRIANSGSTPAVVSIGSAGYTLGLHGRLRIVAARPVLVVRPARVVVPAHGAATVAVTGRAAAPGDHPALVLLATERSQSDIAVRLRLGVVAIVRGVGPVVHRVVLDRLTVHGTLLSLWLRNRGNVVEPLRIVVRIGAAVLRDTRQLLPRSRGVSTLRVPRRLRGAARARVTVGSGAGIVRRAFRIRLRAG